MWSYVHLIQIWISEVSVSCLSILLIFILPFFGLNPDLLQSLSMLLLIFIFLICLLESFTSMFFSQRGYLADILNQISHFDEGTQYEAVAVSDSHISVSDGHNIRSLSPRSLYSYEVCLGSSEKDRKVMVFMRVLNDNITPLEKQFFDKLRKAVSRGNITEYSSCKYGRVISFE